MGGPLIGRHCTPLRSKVIFRDLGLTLERLPGILG